MLGMLVRRLALVFVLCMAFVAALEQIDRPAPPLVIDAAPAHARTAVEIGGGDGSLFRHLALPEIPAISHPSPYMMDTSTLAFLECGDFMGTAVYLGSGRYVTAAHVVTDEKTGKPSVCHIAGQLVSIEKMDLQRDYALIKAAHYPPFRAAISCERLQEGEIYFAAGFASGNPWPVVTRLRGAGQHETAGLGVGTADVNGALVKGMSGGSVSDSEGLVHAINDWNDEDGVPVAGVVELADTPLCGRN